MAAPTRLPFTDEEFARLTDAELVRYVDDPHIFTADRHLASHLSNYSKVQIRLRIKEIPNIIPSRCEHANYDDYWCAFCGWEFKVDHILGMRRHFNEDGSCRGGFDKNYKCCCGKQLKNLYDAKKHRVNNSNTWFGNIQGCLARKQELESLYCKACEFQASNKKQLDEHCASKQHYLKTHPDEFYCKVCDVDCEYKSKFIRHCEGKQHQYKANPDNRPKLYCEICDVKCLSQKQFQTHLATTKHSKKAAASGSP